MALTAYEKQQQQRQRHPERVRARLAVYKATRRGDLMRPAACQRCGMECRPEASHNDYGRQLDVEWLCKPCHVAKDAAHPTPTTPRSSVTVTAPPAVKPAKKPAPLPRSQPAMTAPPLARRPAGRPPKIRNRVRWGLYVNAEHRRAGEERAAEKGHGDYTDVLRSLMAAYASGHLDAFISPPEEL